MGEIGAHKAVSIMPGKLVSQHGWLTDVHI